MFLRGSIHSLNNLMDEQEATPCLSRRGFLQVTAAATAGGLFSGSVWAKSNSERCISVYSPNTGEMIRMVYWTPTEDYIEESISEISHVMRDRHNGSVKRIDKRLLDQIYALQLKLEPKQPIHILCGYRSPSTNANMRRHRRGVAKDSLHMRGQAADIRMPDRDFSQLHRAALSLQAGGVGRYRRSRFIHLDTGAVRNWG